MIASWRLVWSSSKRVLLAKAAKKVVPMAEPAVQSQPYGNLVLVSVPFKE